MPRLRSRRHPRLRQRHPRLPFRRQHQHCLRDRRHLSRQLSVSVQPITSPIIGLRAAIRLPSTSVFALGCSRAVFH